MSKPFLSTYECGSWDKMFLRADEDILFSKSGSSKGFFHYTSLSAAEKILNLNKESREKLKGFDDFVHDNQNDYITLLASHFLFLNDGEELFQGIEIINSVYDEIIANSKNNKVPRRAVKRLKSYKSMINSLKPNCLENAPNFFIICFCSEGNLLTQWEWYGKDCGIAIEFDLGNCGFEGNISSPENESVFPAPANVHKIAYTPKDKEAMKNSLKNFLISNEYDADYFALLSLITAAHMKHAAFKSEKERRLLVAPLYKNGVNSNKALSLIKYRETNGIIKPYMEIHLKHNDPQKHPIKSVTVGPGPNQALVYSAIQKLIHSRFAPQIEHINEPRLSKSKLYEYTEIGGIEVRRSTIPFRG